MVIMGGVVSGIGNDGICFLERERQLRPLKRLTSARNCSTSGAGSLLMAARAGGVASMMWSASFASSSRPAVLAVGARTK